MPTEDVLVKRVMPHSIEAEQSVIGSMLYSQDAIGTAVEILNRDDFYQHSYGVLFETIVDLYQAGKATDIVTLQNALKTKDVPPEVYSLDFLKDLLNSVFTAANIRSYAQIVADKSMLRKTIRTLEDLTNECYLEKQDASAIMEQTEKEVFSLLEKRTDSTSEPIEQTVIRVVGSIQEAAKSGGGITGIPTGFKYLDEMTSGLQKSDLILIAGRPSMGKTAFALNLADYIATKKGIVTAMFELEMSREQMVRRLLAMESHLDSQKLQKGNLNELEWDELIAGSGAVAQSKLIIDDTPGITVAELRSRCRKYKLEHGLELVVVDYLQLMAGSGRRGNDNRQQEISEISRGLKSLARELNVPVIALSQLSRAPEQRTDHRPMLADLRESGAIEQDADVVMFIYRDEVYDKDTPKKGVAEIIIAKQRNGPIGTVELAWVPNLTKFSNLEYRRQESGE
ncbi:MAG: replicative DNA helicase [Lachnospiraceae bacterium]|nr:replicative DNA helicase [Lachnospiraceae bacterium]